MKKLILFLLLSGASSLFAAEQFNSSTTIYAVTPTSATVFTIDNVLFHWKAEYISIQLSNSSGTVSKSFRYEGTTARNLMNQMNTANFSTNSMHKQILQRLINDGLQGTISGSPDP